VTWDPLSELDPPNLDYNWNIQVYVTNQKGQEKQLVIIQPAERESPVYAPGQINTNRIVSKKQMNNID